MPDFLLPDLGEGLDGAEIVTWSVQVGDRVEVDQIVVEVETAKAAVEVPIPFAGVVATLHARPGQTVAVGAPLISVTTDLPSSDLPSSDLPASGLPASGVPASGVPAAGVPDAEDGVSGHVLIGYGTSATPRRTRRGSRRPGARPPAAAPVSTAAAAPAATAAAPAATAATRPVPVISPLVRKMARDAGLDLREIVPTGPSGLVRRHDVEQRLTSPAAAAEPEPLAAPGSRIPLRGMRRAMADTLSRSRREIPEATVWVDVDATELLAARRGLNARNPAEPVSLLALLARFAVVALRRYPELNARVDVDEIVLFDHVHLGFAAQTERGLVVPVVRDAERLSTRDLSAALAARTTAARDNRLTPADLTGGTFTVNNYGVFGVDGSAAIINHPEVAILGIGRIIDRPWVVDGELAVRRISQLTLAFDHRACDGGTAGGFLRYVADCVENPVIALGEL